MLKKDNIRKFLWIPMSITQLKTKDFWVSLITSVDSGIWGTETRIHILSILFSPIVFICLVLAWILGTIVTLILFPFAVMVNIEFASSSTPSEFRLRMEKLSEEPKDPVKSTLFKDSAKTTVFERTKPKECESDSEKVACRCKMRCRGRSYRVDLK